MDWMATLGEWLLSDDLSRQKLSLLAFCVVAMYVIGGTLQWRLTGLANRHWRWLSRPTWLQRALCQAMRMAYYVGIPALVLWREQALPELGVPATYVQGWDGYRILRLAGLGSPGDAAHLAVTLATLGGALGLLTTIWVWYSHAATWPAIPGTGGVHPSASWALALREALFLQMSWLFYRVVMRTWNADPIWVACGSVVLVAVTWALSPLRLARLRDPAQARNEVQDWVQFSHFTIPAGLLPFGKVGFFIQGDEELEIGGFIISPKSR